MSDENYNPKNTANNMWLHEPLPYKVTMRETLGDDQVPMSRVYKVVAYSVFEAWAQAVIEAGGTGIEDVKYRAERIEPDVPHFMAMLTAKIFNESLKGKP